MANDLTKITLNLIPQAREDLSWLTEQLRLNNTDAINKAVQLYAYLEHLRIEDGGRLQVAFPDGRTREIMIL